MRVSKIILPLLASSFLALPSVKAQEAPAKEAIPVHQKFGIVVAASVPEGIVLQAAYKIIPELVVRAGVDFFPTISVYNDSFSLGNSAAMAEYKNRLGYVPNADAQFKFGNLSGTLLLDYHPWRNGLRVTAGVLFGAPKVTARAMLVNSSTGASIMDGATPLDPNNMPKITISDQENPSDAVTIQPGGDASIDADVYVGRTVRPYVGIGYGYAVPNTPVSFFMDFGTIFGGKPRVKSPNVIEGDASGLVDYSEAAQKVAYFTQVLPMLNLGISIRL